jgi:hypothetical protein
MEGEGWPPEPRLRKRDNHDTRRWASSNATAGNKQHDNQSKGRRRFCPNCRVARRIRAYSVKVPSCSAANPGRQRSNRVNRDWAGQAAGPAMSAMPR